MIATLPPRGSIATGATAPAHEAIVVIDRDGNRYTLSRHTDSTAGVVTIVLERDPLDGAREFLRAAAAEREAEPPLPWPAPRVALPPLRRPPPRPPTPPRRVPWPVSLRAFR